MLMTGTSTRTSSKVLMGDARCCGTFAAAKEGTRAVPSSAASIVTGLIMTQPASIGMNMTYQAWVPMIPPA